MPFAIIRLSAFLTGRHQPHVSGHLSAVRESIQIAHFGQKDHRGQRADAFDFLQGLHRCGVTLRLGQLPDGLVQFGHLLLDRIHLVEPCPQG
ncbi:MAG: hypothetical protein ACUVXJ_19755 [Phycisphaerae bacterium]